MLLLFLMYHCYVIIVLDVSLLCYYCSWCITCCCVIIVLDVSPVVMLLLLFCLVGRWIDYRSFGLFLNPIYMYVIYVTLLHFVFEKIKY